MFFLFVFVQFSETLFCKCPLEQGLTNTVACKGIITCNPTQCEPSAKRPIRRGNPRWCFVPRRDSAACYSSKPVLFQAASRPQCNPAPCPYPLCVLAASEHNLSKNSAQSIKEMFFTSPTASNSINWHFEHLWAISRMFAILLQPALQVFPQDKPTPNGYCEAAWQFNVDTKLCPARDAVLGLVETKVWAGVAVKWNTNVAAGGVNSLYHLGGHVGLESMSMTYKCGCGSSERSFLQYNSMDKLMFIVEMLQYKVSNS